MTVTWFTTQNLLCGFIRGESMEMVISAPIVNVDLTLQCKKEDMNKTVNLEILIYLPYFSHLQLWKISSLTVPFSFYH